MYVTATHCNTLQHTATHCTLIELNNQKDRGYTYTCISMTYFTENTSTPKSFKSRNSSFSVQIQIKTTISIWICTARYRDIGVLDMMDFGGCSIFSGNCHTCLYIWRTEVAHCNTLQHTATHCNTLQHTAYMYIYIEDRGCALQHPSNSANEYTSTTHQ